ncbi:MAG TPA: HYR domain-containing protein, partial [Sediminibacterium sp.]
MTTTLSPSQLTASKLNASSFTAIFCHHSAKMICSLAVVFLFAASVFAQTTTFNYSGTIVNYTVPAGVTKLTITTKGAQGGNNGGLGASMQGDFLVTPGQVLKILVGGQGGTSSGNSGGGGGSFVTTSTNTPLIIAGGGGGATCTAAGLPGVTSTNGTNGSNGSSSGSYAYGGGGGINGGGGGGSAGRYGAASGGAGLLGNGGRGIASISVFSYATGGGVGGNGTNGGDGTATSGAYTGISNSFIAGGAPGYTYGGFGGGGGVYLYDYCNSGAGGGGYSGGGGSYSSGGGGGGSYNSGTNQVNTTGVRSGNGEVTITQIAPGAAINFDGVDDYLRTTNPFYQYTNAITVEAWINTTQSVWMGQSTPDVDNWSNSNVWLWHIKGPGQGMDWYVNDGGVARGISLNTLSAGWHHIATTANACGMFIYVDGVLTVSSSTGISTGILNVANSVLDIGKDPRYSNVVSTGTDRYTAFSADEVRIWSRSLSKQEINAHKNCELIAGQMTGLQEYYQFNQGFAGDDNTAITTVTDASGNARNASINNLARTGTTSNFISPGGVTTGSNCSAFSLAAITGNGPLGVGGTITLANATAGGTWSSSVPGVATVNASGVVTGVSAGTTVISYTIDCGTAATVTVTVSAPATALKFDPSLAPNDNTRLNYVSVDNPFRTYQKEMTVEFWMYSANANLPFGSVMGQGANNDPQNTVWLMHPNDNGTMTFYVSDGGVLKATTANIIAGGWHHYAGVTSANSTKFYVDGALVHTGPGISGNILNNLTSVIHIGKDVRFATRHITNNDPWNRYATITLDELRIWNRALCAEEIMNNKNVEINPAGQTGLQQYYRFNQGLAGANNASVTTLNDLSGNNRNGTLNNFTLDGANSNWVTSGSTNTGIVNAFVPPTAPITGITSICTGAVSTLANANAGGVWTSSNTAIATVNANTGTVNGVSAGTATITYTTACGGVSTALVTINPIPVVTIAAVGGTSACPGSFVTLNATAPAGSTYQWSKDGVAIPGAVNASYNAAVSGGYSVVIVNNGCTSAASNAVGITIADVTAPTISCPANQILNLDASCNATLPDYRNLLTVNDNCTASNALVITQSPAAGTVVNAKGALIVTFTVTDAANNSQTCTVTVDKRDVTAPVIVCRAPITVNNTANTCGAVVTYTNPTATDNCSGAAFNFWNAGEPNNYQNANEDYVQLYNNATWNDLPDYVLNRSIVEFNSVIATSFANYTLIGNFGGHTYYVSNGTATWLNSRAAAQAIGGDLASINTLAESQYLAPYGGSTWVGGYQDKTVPGFSEPGNASQNYLGWKWVDGTSLGAGQIVITQTAGLPSGSVFPVGVTTNTFTATDEAGNTSTCSFTVTVRDVQPPVITCPANITVNATGAAGAVVTYVAPVGTDNCPGASTVRTAGPASGSVFPIGTTTVTHTVTDAAGLTTSCSFTVTVAGAQPVVVCPANITVSNDPGQCGAKVNFTATETTGIPASTITYSMAPGSVFPVGTTTVTVTATNALGTSTCSFTVTVTATDTDGDGVPDPCDLDADNDGIPNSLECNQSNFFWSSPPTVSTSNVNTATGTINGIAYTYTSTSPVSTTTYMYGHNQFPVSYGVPNVNPTIQNVAVTNNTITFASPMTNPVLVFASIGNAGLPVPITFGAPVEVVWSKDVTINSPTSITGREGYAIVRMMGTFSTISFNYQTAENWCNFAFGADFQNCGDTDNDGIPNYLDTDSDGDGCPDAIEGSMSFSMSQTSGGRLTGGVNSQGIPLLAGAGQTIGTSQNYVLNCFCQPGLDETAPTVITKDITVNLNAGGNVTITPSQVNNGSSDACGIASMTLSKTNFTCSDIGANTVTLTVTDNDGNVSSASAVVTVVDNIPPAITCPANISVIATSAAGAVVNYIAPVGTDNCAGVTTARTAGPASGSIFPLGTTTVTHTVTDGAGLTTSCSFTVTVLGVAPVVVCPATITVNNDPGQCGAVVNFAATETTGIPASTITYSIPSGTFFNVGVTTVTATATNAIGASTCTFTVKVNDTQVPTVITQNVTVYLDNNGQASITPAQVNNGSTDNCGIATMTVSPNTFACDNVSSLVNISTQTIVSDNTWVESTTTYSTGNYCISNVWNGIASPLPTLSSYTVAPTINAYSITPISGTQGLYGLNGVRFFRKTFTLNNLTDIKATLQVAMDNGVQIFINGVAVALKGNMGNTFNGANPVKAVLNSTGANVNGGVGGQAFDNITNTNASSLFVVGTNEIVLALANCDGTDRGAISFKAVIETNNGGQRPVVLTVTDVNGNAATANALVTVVDAINPVLTCQDNIEAIATSASGATVNYVALTATDNCSAVVTRTAGLASGATFPIGTTTVTHTATDPSGNTVSCSFTVTVTGLPPVIVCPANIAVTATAGQCGTNVTFAATESTAIPASVITYTENGNTVSSGSFFTVGIHTITATATNAVGSSVCTFTITVTDTETPVIITPAN